MPSDPAGRRTPRGPRGVARGVAVVRPPVPAPGTLYAGGYTGGHATGRVGELGIPTTAVARLVLAAAAMMTGMVGGGLLFGQAVANWLGV